MSICTVALTPRWNAARVGEMSRDFCGLTGGAAASLGRAGGAASRERRDVAPAADVRCSGVAAGGSACAPPPLCRCELCDCGRGGRSSPRLEGGRCACKSGYGGALGASDPDGCCEVERGREASELCGCGTYESLAEGRGAASNGSPAPPENEPGRRALLLRGAGFGEGAPERLEERWLDLCSSRSPGWLEDWRLEYVRRGGGSMASTIFVLSAWISCDHRGFGPSRLMAGPGLWVVRLVVPSRQLLRKIGPRREAC